MRRRVPSGISLLLLSLAWPVGAEPSQAALRYDQGLKAFEAGNYVVACQQLLQSYRLEPLPGALFTLATCEMRAGRLVSAASRFSEFVDLVATLPPEGKQRQADRLGVAQRERSQLYARIPHLKLVLQDKTHTEHVTLNGATLPPSSLDVELAVDPGEQVIEQHFRDGKVATQRVSLVEGANKLVVLQEPVRVARTPDNVPTQSKRGVLPFVIGGIGVGGVAVGAIAGGFALRDASTVRQECEGAACSPEGKRAGDRGQSEALVSTIAFGVGLTGLVAGVVLLATAEDAKTPQSARVELRVSPGALLLRGVF